MVSFLRPVGLSVDFDDRQYQLGDTMDVTVELDPKTDVELREGRIDLVCEEIYTKTYMVPLATPAASGDRLSAAAGAGAASASSKKVVQQHKESHVHSTALFARDTRLRAGSKGSYNAKLQIQQYTPPQSEEAAADANTTYDVKWRLVTTANVARGRDPKVQRTVKVITD